jgi:hypothetical protein
VTTPHSSQSALTPAASAFATGVTGVTGATATTTQRQRVSIVPRADEGNQGEAVRRAAAATELLLRILHEADSGKRPRISEAARTHGMFPVGEGC